MSDGGSDIDISSYLVAVGGNTGWIFFYLFLIPCFIGMILAIANSQTQRTASMIINVVLVVILIVFIAISYHLLSTGLKIWLGIAFVLLCLGVMMKDMKGIYFNHAISHLCYVLSTVCLFFGFFFHLI